ncbi:hypothetical protein QYM36_018739 [Artemia franciscana]|uniref:carbonyl reductase (NADPH) n=1 Tax=Artemia franciscana TaxID=6661 RepID=A0AA88KRD2_ARTSF|nr:hypothetical protein QYM36_018739 [Artemia franciscana]
MAIKRPHHPMPTFDEAVLKHAGAKYFTKLDARHGYWSLELDEESSELTTFNTSYGRYNFKRMPFGLISVQDEFQHRMEEAFEGIKGFSVIVDDISISGRTDEEHDSNVRSALIRARKKCVKLNLQKCVFKSDSIPYFGHIISEAGIHPDPRKVRALKEMRILSTKDELQTVLGMMNYLARYIPNLSSLNQPLRELVNQREFKWEEEHNSAFTNIKESICDSLSFLDPTSGNIELQVDASKFGLGATILQNGKTVSFASRSLNRTEQNYSQIEKELYTILFGCLHYHQYLFGQKFIVVSDHKPLQVVLNCPISKSSPRLQWMLLKIQPYDFTVIFRLGKEISVADALSLLYLPEEDTETQMEIEASSDAAEALETPHKQSAGNPQAEALTSSPITMFAALTPPPKTPDVNSRPTSHDLSPAFHTPIPVPSTSRTTHADLQGAPYSTRSGRCVEPVTGSNKGIGFAIVKELCQKFDGDVFLTSRDDSRGQAAINQLKKEGFNPKFHQLDIDHKGSVEVLRDFLQKNYGGLDCLVNNAAIAYKNAATEPFGEQAENTIKTNYFSTLNLCNILFPILRPHARVVNVSSSAGFLRKIPSGELRKKLSAPDVTVEEISQLMKEFVESAKAGNHSEKGWPNSTYVVSKVGLSALTRVQHRMFQQDPREDIVVNHVHPGYVDTDMTSHKGVLKPEEGAQAPSWLALLPENVEKPKGDYVWHDCQIVDWLNGPIPGAH